MLRLVADIHLSNMGSHYWQKQQRHAPCGILQMSVNGASKIFSLASLVSYVPIGCRHPFIKYWAAFTGKNTSDTLPAAS